MRSQIFAALLGALTWLMLPALSVAAEAADRSPVDLVLGPADAWLICVNQTSHTASLVDPATGRVLDEIGVGQHPISLARDADGQRVYVTCRDSGDVRILEVADGKLKAAGAIHVGYHPHGIALSPDDKLLYVAQAAADRVAIVELATEKITTVATGRWPRYLALSPDGLRLAVGASGDRGVSVINCVKREQVFHEAFAGLNVGHLAMGDDGKVYFPWMVYRANTITEGNIRLGWVLASRIGRLRLDEASRREAFSLDPPGKAIADVHGLALTKDNRHLVVSAAGTHELLVYRLEGLPFKDYGGTDHVDPKLLADRERFFRIPLGGRPLGLRIGDDNKTVYVANYLHNSIQVVDLQERKVVREIALGSAPEVTLARRGEAIFYDAGRSLDQWYSCHTCHYEGGISSERMDTLNDGSRNTFKTVLPLYNFDKTGPWTWHGWQRDPRAAMRKSLTETMLGPPPDGEAIDALLAYFSQLEAPPNPFRQRDGSLTAAAQRGQRVFASEKAGCATCHSGEHFTDGEIHDVGLSGPNDAYKGFNTPTLVGVYQRVKLLHDGRAKTLEEVLTGPHNPAKVTGKGELSDSERSDLIEYLKSL
jgi:YVTN family beta-propeller protein